jgi:hypothetical protein
LTGRKANCQVGRRAGTLAADHIKRPGAPRGADQRPPPASANYSPWKFRISPGTGIVADVMRKALLDFGL